jgi:hypothetical protein
MPISEAAGVVNPGKKRQIESIIAARRLSNAVSIS